MPIYAFTCVTCGPFDVFRPMAQAADPAFCGTCGSEARRVFSAPGLGLLAKPVRRALEVEERSAHEPEVVREKQGRSRPHRHAANPPWVLSH